MDTDKFIQQFAEALEMENGSSISMETEFRTLEEWDSLVYLNLIALLDEEYDIQIENAAFKKLETVGDIVSYISEHSI